MTSLQEEARRLLDQSARKGEGYYYTAPSPRKYPHQWSWDSAFHAIVNCRLGRPDLATAEVMTLLSSMMPDGSLPHIIVHQMGLAGLGHRLLRCYWPDPHRSPLVQPPVVALAVQEIWRRTGDERFLERALPYLERHFDWLYHHRRFGETDLVSIISPWECGLDHKPAFDPLLGGLARLPFGRYFFLYTSEMRLVRHRFDPAVISRKGYFNVREVLFNVVYALGLEALGNIFADIGDESKSKVYGDRGGRVSQEILSDCLDPDTGLYFDIDVNTGKLLKEPGVSSLMPLALGGVPCDRYETLAGHLTNPDEFWLRFPAPSVPLNSRHFEPEDRRYLWRGPTWINTNWFIREGLRRNGHDDVAEAIAVSSRELVRREGFCEYYNPLTGEGGGQRNFGWSTLAAIM